MDNQIDLLRVIGLKEVELMVLKGEVDRLKRELEESKKEEKE